MFDYEATLVIFAGSHRVLRSQREDKIKEFMSKSADSASGVGVDKSLRLFLRSEVKMFLRL